MPFAPRVGTGRLAVTRRPVGWERSSHVDTGRRTPAAHRAGGAASQGSPPESAPCGVVPPRAFPLVLIASLLFPCSHHSAATLPHRTSGPWAPAHAAHSARQGAAPWLDCAAAATVWTRPCGRGRAADGFGSCSEARERGSAPWSPQPVDGVAVPAGVTPTSEVPKLLQCQRAATVQGPSAAPARAEGAAARGDEQRHHGVRSRGESG